MLRWRTVTLQVVSQVVVFGDTVGGEQSRSMVQLARVLQYLECPQYLRYIVHFIK